MEVSPLWCEQFDRCSEHGKCISPGPDQAEYCQCDVGFAGEDCSQKAVVEFKYEDQALMEEKMSGGTSQESGSMETDVSQSAVKEKEGDDTAVSNKDALVEGAEKLKKLDYKKKLLNRNNPIRINTTADHKRTLKVKAHVDGYDNGFYEYMQTVKKGHRAPISGDSGPMVPQSAEDGTTTDSGDGSALKPITPPKHTGNSHNLLWTLAGVLLTMLIVIIYKTVKHYQREKDVMGKKDVSEKEDEATLTNDDDLIDF